jgi:Ca2+-binding EF-hand superfamily protein
MGNANTKKKGSMVGTSIPEPDEGKVRKNSKYGKVEPELVKKLQEETHFDKVEVRKLFETFNTIAADGKLDRSTFKQALGRLEEAGLKRMDDTPFADRLFDLLDVNQDGAVDLQEFVTGLSFLCKGTPEEKLELSFKAYDLDGNGYISKEELALMFKQAWIAGITALCTAHGNDEFSTRDAIAFSEEMGNTFANSAFDALDTNGDGQLSFEEFKAFALAEPKITATLNGFKKEVVITF